MPTQVCTANEVVSGLRAFRRRGTRATFGIWVGRGWGGRAGNYVRSTRMLCNLQCFLIAQILAKKPRLRRETTRALQCFCVKKTERFGIRSIPWTPDMSLFLDQDVLMQFARKGFLRERLLYLPERLRNSSV